MKAWSAPTVPALPGVGTIPTIHDTVEAARHGAFGSRDGEPAGGRTRPARLYVCGITPYDATHIGHAATYVTFDLLVRAWRDAGLDVRYVQNVTDVDDPLLERAAEIGEDWAVLAQRQTDLFTTDMAALRVVPPTYFVGAVESIPLIVELIERIVGQEATYELDGDLYLRVGADSAFGTLAQLDHATMTELFGERGGDPAREGKKDPLDCLLWQRARPGEPAWDSTLGRGRPGWHVECAAIALHYLAGEPDIQGGGTDLIFPHHEMTATAARLATGSGRFAQGYMHQAMVGLAGEKMSKSRGNLVFVSQLRADGVDPMAIRLALLARHYRQEWEWGPELLGAAEGQLARWRSAISCASGPPAGPVLEQVRAAVANDLDSPSALTAIDAWAAAALIGDGDDLSAPEMVRGAANSLLGVAL